LLCYLNQWGTLRWTCNSLISSLIFLDLWILIGSEHHLIFQTYQKPMNLYLHIISPGWAHPEKMFCSLIFGGLPNAYWLENTHISDFYAMTVLLT
jgi:hypothetical protein